MKEKSEISVAKLTPYSLIPEVTVFEELLPQVKNFYMLNNFSSFNLVGNDAFLVKNFLLSFK